MDLDGAGSPMALVAKILKAEPGLALPVPIEDLARQLDISEIRVMETDGFEGGLVTDLGRSEGFILVNARAGRARRRFTVGHELGHFLMTHHSPKAGSGFECTRGDMRVWSGKETSPAVRMEVEANEFAALILMPPPMWRSAMAAYRDPDLRQVTELAAKFAVSKEAAARAYAQYHDEPLAIVVTQDGRVNRVYGNFAVFPRPCVRAGAPVPAGALLHRLPATPGTISAMVEARAEQWLESEWGKPLPALYEQVAIQREGFAMILLWAERAEEQDDGEDERTSKERLRDRQAAWPARR
jgi:hypothetical protein